MRKHNNIRLSVFVIALIFLLVQLVCISLFVIFNSNVNITFALSSESEQRHFDLPNIDDDFSDDCVIVLMDDKTGGANKIHSETFFGDFAKSVEDLTYITGNISEKNYLDIEDFNQILKIELKEKSKQSVINAIKHLESVDGIIGAEPNYYIMSEICSFDDIYPLESENYSKLWGLHGERGINAEDAWKIVDGNKSIRIGIIDTGIANHIDLQPNLVDGWDFINDNNVTTDDENGHGTHVAGIIGALGTSNNSIVGVCPNVQLVPLQALNEIGKGSVLNVVSAINWCIDNNVDIINFSEDLDSASLIIKSAIKNFKGLFVCAAGNGTKNDGIGKNNDDIPNYPSYYSQGYDFSNRIISVGAIKADGTRTEESNWGNSTVSIFAPGHSILSTVPTSVNSSGYVYWGGTSMATPYVSGVAALMYAMVLKTNSNMSRSQIAEQIKIAILEGAMIDEEMYLVGKCVSGGRLDAVFALSKLMFNIEELSNDTIRIDGLKYQYNGELTIPKKIGGKSVTQIGNGAFANQTGITKVYVPSTVESIGANAFENCTQMQYIEFDEGSQLTTIGNSAFSGSGLWNIVFPSTVNNIGFNAFQNCQTLMAVEFKQGCLIETISNATFSGCVNLLAITIPASVKTIGANAFENCNFATRCDFMQGSQLETIGNSAFANTKIQNFAIPTGVTYIGSNAFYGCSEMETIVIPGGVQTVGVTAFGNCENLTIYTSLSNTPSGWVGGWNSLNRPVVLNCQLQNGYVLSFAKTDSNPFNANAANGLNNPYKSNYDFGGWYTTSDFSGTKYENISNAPNGTLYVKWTQKESCVAEGTMITLADGTQKPVEQLTGNEMLLVWNMFTGTFDSAPILFIDSDPYAEYEITRLSFSDGTQVKLIYEHGFWDFDLNKYVYLRNDAAQYIGHTFNKQTEDESGNLMWTAVELVAVDVYTEYTTAWSPVTYGHLCYYVNGMLSMPGGITGLFNIFDVDGETLKVDEESMAADIAEYGLYTYEEFAQECPVPQEMFEAVNGQYLKVAIGKGNITMEEIIALAQRYAEFFYCNNAE